MKNILTILFLIISLAAFTQNRGRKAYTYLNLDSVKVAGTTINATKITSWNTGGASSTLAGLSDVNISSPSNLQVLQYQTGNSKWNNHTLAVADISDIGSTYQTLANLSTNTSLGSSNTVYPSQLAVKTYVDNVSSTQTPKAAVDYATAAALAANTYANGSSGVGATITMNATGTVTIDGHVTALNENILIKDESSQLKNGIYTVTTAGAGGVAGVFTRRTDFDVAAEIIVGAETFVINGTANGGKKFTQNATVTTVGTDAVTFVQTGGASGVSWGAITGTLSTQTDLQTALNLKANLASPTFTGTVTHPTPFTLGATSVTTTGTQLNYLNAATGTTGTTSTNVVFSTSPTLTTPTIGVATATSINKITITQPATSATLTIDNGFTLHVTGDVTTLSGSHTGTSSGTNTGDQTSVTGNAGTATALQNARTINGTSFDGTANITVTAAAGTLTGATLASGVTASSLTSFGNSPTIVTPSFTTGFTIGGAAASGKIPIGNGTNYVASTPTYPNTATSGSFLIGDGTNITLVNTRANWTSLIVSGSNFTTSSTSLVDITGLVTGTLSTATLYEFECDLYVNSSSTAGMAVGVQQSGTGSGQIGVWSGTATSATATGAVIASNVLNQAGAACVLVNGDGHIKINGFIKTGSSGSPTISMKALKTTSGTATVLIGSVLRYRVAN